MIDLNDGDEEAFIKIYKFYWQKVFRIAYQRVRSREIAEELAQDLFLKLWEKRDTLKVDDVGKYIFCSIKNAVIDHIRTGIRFNKYTEHYQTFVHKMVESTNEAVKFTDLEEAITTGLSQLPEKTQVVFKLNRLENWPLERISNHLNLSEKTVGYHLTKALKFMRTYLKEFIFTFFIFVW